MSIAEAAYHIGVDASRVCLVMQPYPEGDDPSHVDNNRARSYLTSIAKARAVPTFGTVEEAVAALVEGRAGRHTPPPVE
jgi:hypothetical protein